MFHIINKTDFFFPFGQKLLHLEKVPIVMLLLFFYLRAERYYCVVGVRLIETLDFAIVQKKENLHVPIVPEIHTVYTHYMDTGPIESRKKNSVL